MSEPKYQFVAWGYSDDCAGISGAEEDSEYETPSTWFELLVDGEVIGRCRMHREGSAWQFEFESDTHALYAGKKLTEDRC